MSWFDTAGIANLAKSALKEAQKTIDKALDINEEQQPQKSSKPTLQTSPSTSDANTESFFLAWGLSPQEDAAGAGMASPPPQGVDGPPPLPHQHYKRMTTSSSLWGSFTGSFFENSQNEPGTSGGEVKKYAPSRSLSLDLTGTTATGREPPPRDEDRDDSEGERIRDEIRSYPQVEVVMRRRGENRTSLSNRLSVISSESDRRSSDSCDVLGSTPDSDPSSMSTSSSVAKLRQSGSFESIEVLTSPSSIDVISSSVASPADQKYSSDSISPVAEGDGVEVIPEDEDDLSVEDSYTSASENTVTVLTLHDNSNLMLKSTSSLDTSFSEAMSPRDSVRLSICQRGDRPPGDVMVVSSSRGGEQATAEVSATPPSSLPQVSTSAVAVELSTSVNNKSVTESMGSDTDALPGVDNSSCEEGTLMGSSGEAETLSCATRVSSSGGATGGDSLSAASNTSSQQLSHMLADAMNEPSTSIREQSPISSERSDLVKIGSSEHTSGDELETTTSSDIEIISSPTPNGDSSSTSRHSPAKLAYRGLSLGRIATGKVKGHHREPSETSSGGSDECSEVDKLLKRIAEMSEILEARESKLIDLSRLNADLQETNSDLKTQLERQSESQEIRTMSEEFTQRMAALERKFQQAVREKELLRKQLDHAKSMAVKREDDLDKEQLISELRSEGEKLSKQQLTLNNALKKLRAIEKENTKTITYLNEQLSEKGLELERCKKAVTAKEEMERSHIEAVHNLTKHNLQLEKEVASLKSNLAALTNTVLTAHKELGEKDEAYKALEEKREAERKMIEEQVLAELSSDLEASEQQVMTLQSALEDMRRQLIISQEQHLQIEKGLRGEVNSMLTRAESAERRAEERAEALSCASQPLARQLQSLTETHSHAATTWHAHEQSLVTNINELERRVESLSASERSVREEYRSAVAQNSVLQEKLSTLQHHHAHLQAQHAKLQLQINQQHQIHSLETKQKAEVAAKVEAELCQVRRELVASEELLSVERAALEAEKTKNLILQERLRGRGFVGGGGGVGTPGLSPRSSPTLSCGRVSISESVASSVWPTPFGDDEPGGSISGRLYEALRPCNNTTFLETLQAQLKLKDGEVQQLQWEIARRESERNALSNEVSDLTTRLSQAEKELANLGVLRTQYDALLQMYGEKLEESEELKMDLQDVKEMYKAQIDELLKKEPGGCTPAPPPAS